MTFAAPIQDRYFEDYIPGDVHEFGDIVAEEAEMIAFARRFDPQPFHTDPVAAKESIFGGLIASGWYTSGLMRLYADYYLSHNASLGSPGVDDLRWLKPLRPGDSISIRVTVTDTKRSSSKPDRGIVHSYVEVLNQHREIIMSMKGTNFLACRE